MDFTVILSVFLTIVLDVAIVIFLLKRRRAKRNQAAAQLEVEATKEGWESTTLNTPGVAYHIQGSTTPGIVWELEAHYPRGSGSKRSSRKGSTVWKTTSVQLPDGIIAVGPISSQKLPNGVDLGNRFVQMALQNMFGEELATALASAELVALENQELATHYALFTTNPTEAETFLRSPVAEALLDWQIGSEGLPSPAIILWKGGLSVRFHKTILDAGAIRTIVALCEVLVVRATSLPSIKTRVNG